VLCGEKKGIPEDKKERVGVRKGLTRCFEGGGGGQRRKRSGKRDVVPLKLIMTSDGGEFANTSSNRGKIVKLLQSSNVAEQAGAALLVH